MPTPIPKLNQDEDSYQKYYIILFYKVAKLFFSIVKGLQK